MFPLIVQSFRLVPSAKLYRPPPRSPAEFPLMMQSVRVSSPPLTSDRPPPTLLAEFSLIVQSDTLSVNT